MKKTAWEKRTVVEQNQNQDPFEQISVEPMEVLDAFDRDKNDLLDYAEHVKNSGFKEYDQTVAAVLVFNTARSFAKATTVIRETSPDDETAKESIIRFWKAIDNERVETFRTLLGNETHQFITDSELKDFIKEAYNETADPGLREEYIMDMYKMYLQIDVYNFFRNLQVEPENVPAELTNLLYDQGPGVTKLVSVFEKMAQEYNKEYKHFISEGCTISDGSTDPGGEFATSITLKAERTPYKNSQGKLDYKIVYELESNIEYLYGEFYLLPNYVQDYLLDQANQEECYFTDEMLLNEESSFKLKYAYTLTADNEGGFWPHHDLDLFMDDISLPLPDYGGFESSEIPSELGEEELDFLTSIFDQSEMDKIKASNDVIEAFRLKMGDTAFATTNDHIDRARDIAKQLIKATHLDKKKILLQDNYPTNS